MSIVFRSRVRRFFPRCIYLPQRQDIATIIGQGSLLPITYYLDRSLLFPTSTLFLTGILLSPLPDPQGRRHGVSLRPVQMQRKNSIVEIADTIYKPTPTPKAHKSAMPQMAIYPRNGTTLDIPFQEIRVRDIPHTACGQQIQQPP